MYQIKLEIMGAYRYDFYSRGKKVMCMHFCLILLFFGSALLFASEDFDRQQILERIKPIGEINIENQKKTDTTSPPSLKEKTVAKDEPVGKATYEKYCSICHRDGVAGAPKFQVAADWASRLNARKLEGLVATAVKGINAMPPKGTCSECSDEDIKNAIQYMLPKS
jgi:cytochrome c5